MKVKGKNKSPEGHNKPSVSPVLKQGTQTENIVKFLERSQNGTNLGEKSLLRPKGETPSGTSDTDSRKLPLPDDIIGSNINSKPLTTSPSLVLKDPKCDYVMHCTIPLDKELLFETCSVGID